jgi:hypothetical protein
MIFTPQAQTVWDNVADPAQQKVLANVWCVHCRQAVTMVHVGGTIKEGDLILQGRCSVCGHPVMRLMESQ